MARRLFFVDEVHSGHALIEGDEAGHLTRVLRVEAGQRYEISDNQQLYLGEVEWARKSEVRFRIIEKLPCAEPLVRLHLYPALIKFDHMEWTLEKATELGVAAITPLLSERSEKGLDKAAEKRTQRWRKIIRESAQQCRRWQLPELNALTGVKRIGSPEGIRLLLEESVAPPILRALPAVRDAGQVVHVMVGPEGGWTDGERALLAGFGWTAVSLGATILRAETAATAALAILAAVWAAEGQQ